MGGVDLASIVAAAYDAALQDELWEPWAEDLFCKLGGSGGLFGFHDAEKQELNRIISLCAPARAIEEYVSGYYQFDPQIPFVSSLPNSCSYIDLPEINDGPKEVDDYLRWQDDIAQMPYHQTAVFKLDDAPFRVSICVHKTREFGAVTRDEHRTLRRLIPQLEHAFRLAFRHNEMLASTFWDGVVVGRAGQIAFLLDEQGRVLRHTDAANALIDLRDGIDIVTRQLTLSLSSEGAALQAIIAGAITRANPTSGSMRISRPSGKRPLVLICHPLQQNSRMIAPLEAAALITIIDPHSPRQYPVDLYRQAFGLTAREAEMAAAIIAGHSPESAAVLLGISNATARTHLCHLFEKTGTSGQATLVGRLVSIA